MIVTYWPIIVERISTAEDYVGRQCPGRRRVVEVRKVEAGSELRSSEPERGRVLDVLG